MTVITPLSHFHDTLVECFDVVSKTKDVSDTMNTTMTEINNIKEAQKFLKENNCADIINNPNKKINWV
jgi:hypothetical protein